MEKNRRDKEMTRRKFLQDMGRFSAIAAFALSSSSIFLEGCGGSSGGNDTADANIAGTWNVSEQWAAACNFAAGSDAYTVTFQQSGTTVTGTDSYGASYSGTVSGNKATITSSWNDTNAGTINVTWNLTRQSDGSWNGTCTWLVANTSCSMNITTTLTSSSTYSDTSWTNTYSDTSWTNNYSDWSNSWSNSYSDVYTDWYNFYGDWINSW